MKKDMNIAVNVHGEMVENKGEDSYSEFILDDRGYMGIFDGCGGIGSKRYNSAQGHTGAYLASRLAALLMHRWVKKNINDTAYFMNSGVNEDIQKYLQKNFSAFKAKLEVGEGVRLKGGLSKSLPTTASCFFYQCMPEHVDLKFMWAGDSRGYIVDAQGLAQITDDDIDDAQDAFSNLTNDSKLENVINADHGFVLNQKQIRVTKPCMALVATDGIFAYIPTPMEFEYLLLATLQKAASFEEWQKLFGKYVAEYASDDYTMSVGVFGFDSFDDVKAYYSPRLKFIYLNFIKKMNEERSKKQDVDYKKYWDAYKESYERYLV